MSATSRGRVVVVGSVNRDYVCSVDRLPGPGETVLGGELIVGSGGKGGNQAVAAAYAGVTCALVACVGADADGQALLSDLAEAGVDTTRVLTAAETRTGTAFVLVAPDGENSIVVAPGANAELDPAHVSTVLGTQLRPADVLVAQGEIGLESIVAAITTAAERGARVVLNLAPFRQLPDAALGLADPLVVNQSEASALIGESVQGIDGARQAAVALLGRVRSAVITLGGDGAVIATSEGTEHVRAEPAKVVDSTGAGDALTGVLAAALSLGHDLETAVRWGVVAGTYVVSRPGAQASYPRAPDLAAAMEHWPENARTSGFVVPPLEDPA